MNIKSKDIKSSTIDKFARNINNYDKNANITSADLVIDDKSHITKFNRIDEKK